MFVLLSVTFVNNGINNKHITKCISNSANERIQEKNKD